MTGPRLRTVKVDPFATSDIAREENLSANQAWVLHLMAIQAGYRSQEWTGTLSVLADDTRLAPRTVRLVVQSLTDKGLLQERNAFRQGMQEGRVFVVARERIVHEDRPASELAQISTRSRADSDEIATIVENDQGKEGGHKVLRHQGSKGLDEGEICESCGEPLQGHTFGDHEPLAAHETNGSAS